MNADLFKDTVTFITPFMQTESQRQALVAMTFQGNPLLNRVNWTGNARTFTVQLVQLLVDFGDLQAGQPAIVALLTELRNEVGTDKQAKLDDLISQFLGDGQPAAESLPVPSTAPAADHLFISYASQDRASFVENLATQLHERGYPVWVDNLSPDYEGIRAGQLWRESLANAVNRAAAVLLIITPDSIRSKWVNAEIQIAHQLQKPILPLVARPVNSAADRALLQGVKLGDHALTDVQQLDFTQMGFAAGLTRLAAELEKLNISPKN